MEFSRREYWSGLPFPTPGDLPDPGIEPVSLVSPALAGGFFTSEPLGKLHFSMFFSSCDSVVGDFLEFNQANRGSLCV